VLHFLVRATLAALRPKALLVAEKLCLRQQLLILQRSTRRRACAMQIGSSGFAPVDGSLVGAILFLL
jgi:hypothetical protein